ncbi:MAG: hemerythrin domain-containing protein [Candidatus Heimdallarchaeota archaeon]|nr:hemerythrin domain-containing protein [Candidatus Heimdallarchaeota archaeon]
MFSFFKKDKDKQPGEEKQVNLANTEVAPGTGITYKKDLIDRYKLDHQYLLTLYNAANDAFVQGEYSVVAVRLNEMREALRKHLLDEELNFYVYMLHCYSHDIEVTDIIVSYKKEMKQLGLTAFGFLKKCVDMGDTLSSDENFLREFKTVGQLLIKRISSEENQLYPLYRPPGEFH